MPKVQDINFIHINKTAGTSIGKALNLPFQHKTAEEVITEIGLEQWNESYNFTFIRNPWDKVVSHYFHRIKTNQTNLRTNPVSFTDWVIQSYGENNPKYYDKPKMFMPQYKWLTFNNNIVVKNIFRFEHLESDFKMVSLHIQGKANELPHEKKTERAYYQTYFNNKTKAIVHDWFKMDIKLFNYKF